MKVAIFIIIAILAILISLILNDIKLENEWDGKCYAANGVPIHSKDLGVVCLKKDIFILIK
jgi:hypothetical protein